MRRLFALVLLLSSCNAEPAEAVKAPPPPAAAAAPSTFPGLPAAYDRTYGVYLNNAKVGWMRSTLVTGKTVTIGVELHAAVGGMGQVSNIEVTESRGYDATSGALKTLYYEQKAATGAVKIRGVATGEKLELSIDAGNQTQKQELAAHETLKDALAQQTLISQGKVGASVQAAHFDPSLQKEMTLTHKLTGSEDLMLAGVAMKAMRVDTTYPDLGITETSWIDSEGQVLETRVGGFFVARLEPPDVAKRLDFQQDLLVSAVVKAPVKLDHPSDTKKLTLTFTGFEDLLPPSSTRQKVTKTSKGVELVLTRDPELPAVALSPAAKGADAQANLVSTPFIQSDAQPIRDAAKRVVGDSTQLPDVVAKLTHYVYEHVRDEYVPAYSNALEALESGRGDCTEHSVLFVALARALGIPARVAVGIAYWPPGDGFGWHAWAEVMAPDGRWYTVDPTWDQPIADATHVKLADGGPAEQARIVMLLGRLHVVAMDRR